MGGLMPGLASHTSRAGWWWHRQRHPWVQPLPSAAGRQGCASTRECIEAAVAGAGTVMFVNYLKMSAGFICSLDSSVCAMAAADRCCQHSTGSLQLPTAMVVTRGSLLHQPGRSVKDSKRAHYARNYLYQRFLVERWFFFHVHSREEELVAATLWELR